ncbi:FAD binding domain protein [Xylaria sp. FL1042]|nr:FAD binding domain protein [Xylaria sp. FL1042]
MEVIVAVVGWMAQMISRSSSTAGISFNIQNLTDKLSSSAQVYLPGSNGFNNATARWSSLDTPNFRMVVAPNVENDVAEIVKFANGMNIPYLAVTGGHGAITTVKNVHDGIGIWMKNLDSVEIAPDGLTAAIGGGALTKVVVDTLWAAGKQTVTGICHCTSILGPGLGGGHGALQGRYGLVSDQFVSMNVVLGNGTMITVDETRHSDLWWAMRGAGHNFGIVTSVSSKIYDIQNPNWAYTSFIYTGDKVKSVFDTINNLFPRGTQSVDILTLVLFVNNYDVDPTKPLVAFYVLQEGVDVVDPIYTTPFQSLGPIMVVPGSGPYTDLPAWIGEDNDSPSCMKAGLVNIRFPIDIEFYNTTALQSAYDLFAATTQEYPALNNSAFLFEGYSLQAVKKIRGESSAFPFRQDNYLVSPLIIYPPGSARLDETAFKFGEDLRQILYIGTQREELHTYVNYAYGDETPRNWYGYDQWRQSRLSALKKSYDPLGKFNFYAPIVAQ